MGLDELQEEWTLDCQIDDDHLDRESTRTPNLHAKYLNHLIRHKMLLAKTKGEHAQMRTKKFRYYRGEMSRDELSNAGWEQWQGVKPLKNEMTEFLEGDGDLIKTQMKIEYYEAIIQFLESVMKAIGSRDWQIRNAIQWKSFISGA